MTKPGPRPKPTAELAAHGSRVARNRPDYDPAGTQLLVAAGVVPEMAIDMPERGVEAWNYYAPMLAHGGILMASDEMALDMLCRAWADYMELDEFVAENGTAYEIQDQTGNVVWKPYPHVAQREAAQARCFKMMKEFGMTPSARTSFPPRTPEKSANPDEQPGEFD